MQDLAERRDSALALLSFRGFGEMFLVEDFQNVQRVTSAGVEYDLEVGVRTKDGYRKSWRFVGCASDYGYY